MLLKAAKPAELLCSAANANAQLLGISRGGSSSGEDVTMMLLAAQLLPFPTRWHIAAGKFAAL